MSPEMMRSLRHKFPVTCLESEALHEYIYADNTFILYGVCGSKRNLVASVFTCLGDTDTNMQHDCIFAKLLLLRQCGSQFLVGCIHIDTVYKCGSGTFRHIQDSVTYNVAIYDTNIFLTECG